MRSNIFFHMDEYLRQRGSTWAYCPLTVFQDMSLWAPKQTLPLEQPRTYALVGFIFYLLGVIGSILAWFFLLLLFVPPTGVFAFAIFLPVFLGITALVNIGLTIWAWLTLRNIEEGRYAEARAAFWSSASLACSSPES